MPHSKNNPADYTKYVDELHCAKRLDLTLAALFPEFSRAKLQQFIQEGRVQVNQNVVFNQRQKTATGDAIFLNIAHLPTQTEDLPENIPLNIVFEDSCILVINKPAGLTVHPGNGQKNGTLLNALLFYHPQFSLLPRAGIVHRLDKNTSGLMVVAKTLQAQHHLVQQLQNRSLKRHYWALIHGELKKNFKIEKPIGRHPKQRTKMAIVPEQFGGKPAITHVEVIQSFQHATLVLCKLETGRTHQIRVHLASCGFALIGDPVYGKKNATPFFPRQALHAFRLGLIHPENGAELFWQVALPEDFQNLIQNQKPFDL